MSKHPHTLPYHDGDLKELAQEIGNLQYDKLAEFLYHLESDLEKQSENDARKGRVQLSNTLREVHLNIQLAIKPLEKAWRICKPYMK